MASEALVLGASAATSCIICCVFLVIWRKVVGPAFPAYSSCSAQDRSYLDNSAVNLFPAIVVPALVLAAGLPEDAAGNLLDVDPAPLTLVAVGVCVGYMLYDTVFCLCHVEHRTVLNLGHHLFSMAIWPYAMLRHRCVVFVSFFCFTEITSILQHSRMILLKLGYGSRPAYTLVGVGWTISFFFVRILPSPFFLYLLVTGNYEQFSSADLIISMSTLPIPFVLNAYWFHALVAGVIKFLRKQPQRGEHEEALLKK